MILDMRPIHDPLACIPSGEQALLLARSISAFSQAHALLHAKESSQPRIGFIHAPYKPLSSKSQDTFGVVDGRFERMDAFGDWRGYMADSGSHVDFLPTKMHQPPPVQWTKRMRLHKPTTGRSYLLWNPILLFPTLGGNKPPNRWICKKRIAHSPMLVVIEEKD
ncbi:hypothetical protein BC830DRAFT_36803 [Chytriomyces sp. MP71]|nr:hypothetical protein BC830DRAFT_36803 [Chytriomyces sp. MP71]